MKYKVRFSSSCVYEWTTWGTYAGNNQTATCYDRNGMIVLRCFEKSASACFIAKGKIHRFYIAPCPTRAGLVRMAKRWLRETIKNGAPNV